ncbi:MAG TPA: Stk1 family PASTA domain-containing Ser/Thr kinase [Micromonosporaceae bacterium]|nr:Stk1 family PASTA domain-containing Ser/Thr kinase [Micromonosporaceae bacterium]
MNAGRLLGSRYEVGEVLGYGGMAEVHHGRDTRLGRDVAIKMLRADLARDATFQMRFGREAQNAAALNHPSIVAVYDTGEERGLSGEPLPFIVMEFVNGRTLKEVLTAEGPMQPRRALEISAEICGALEFSHRHGIIHRDVKPGNVMLTRAGQVKVMDFGIARALASGASTMTQTSAVIGTAQYLSPEQARGETVDARSDVYATGCVVYELLTGRPPFVGDNPVSVAYQHVREEARPPSAVNRAIGPDVDAVVLKALAKNPANRYQSAAEMRADLLRAAAGRPVMATPILREDPTSIVPQRAAAGYAGRPPAPVRNAGAPRRRTSAWVMVTLTVLGFVALIALGVGLYLTNRTQDTHVPNLVGRNLSDASALLQQQNLVLGTQTQQNSTSCTPGAVLSTIPTAGKPVPPNSRVDVTYCAGPGSVQGGVPVVTGLTQDQAVSQLKSVGLTPKVQPVDSTAASGIVVGVKPDEHSPVNVGDTVTIEVSKGNQAKLDDLTGMTQAEALSHLNSLGFTNTEVVLNTVADPAQDGLVTGQKPAAGKTYFKNTKITIFVGQSTPTGPPSGSPSPSPSG